MTVQQRCTKCGTLLQAAGSCPSCLEANRRAWDNYSESKPVATGERPLWQKVLIGVLVLGLVKFAVGVLTGSVK